MRYLRCFKFSDETVRNPNIYPYNVFKNKTSEVLMFDTITLLYGENGSGKSSFLNLLASKLKISGAEPTKSFGNGDYFQNYLQECIVTFDCDEEGREYRKAPNNSRYIKSEDILYEVKKIQQEAVLREGYIYQRRKLGMTKEQVAAHKDTFRMEQQIERLQFAQEKYSNGETAMQIFEDYLVPDGLYLLDEPEASLSPEKQLKLAEIINQSARFLGTQFVIATHSPLILGSLEGTIYNFSQTPLTTSNWAELANVKVYADFFKSKDKFFR